MAWENFEMTKTYRLAVIGCGIFAQNHLNAWNEDVDGVQIAAVFDVDPAKAEATGRRFGMPWYTDATEMFDGDYRRHLIKDRQQSTRTVEFPRYRWSDSIWYMVQDSVVNTQRHWGECLRSGKETETSGRQNLRTLEMVFGAYESVEKGIIYHASHGFL